MQVTKDKTQLASHLKIRRRAPYLLKNNRMAVKGLNLSARLYDSHNRE
jgi:hypothetical protein